MPLRRYCLIGRALFAREAVECILSIETVARSHQTIVNVEVLKSFAGAIADQIKLVWLHFPAIAEMVFILNFDHSPNEISMGSIIHKELNYPMLRKIFEGNDFIIFLC